MKKGLIFFLGMITGVLLFVFVAMLFMLPNSQETGEDDNISLFATPGETMNLKSFEIMQVLPNGSALAWHSSR